jgi:2'-5' RNA ligase
MSNLVIVAIPREDDPVWKYSSEKKPHCTLLFLGENQSKSVAIAQFLQHAVTIWDRGPFGLSVDHRDTLGDDEADVLFFRKDWSTKELASFRATLLKNKDIRDAYDSAEQFPEWNPHLTMGYKSTPAKKDERDYPGFHWVEFDRIALWTGDYEGPEFRLEYNYDPMGTEVMMSAQKGEEFVQHFGVKGMKWGVRKVRGSDSEGRSRYNKDFQKKEGRGQTNDTISLVAGVIVPIISPLAIPAAVRTGGRVVAAQKRNNAEAADHKFTKKAQSMKTMADIHNRSIPALNREQTKINAKYKNVNLTDPKNAAKARKYDQETADMMAREYQKTANATKSKTGNLQYDVELRGNNTIALKTKKIKHADADEPEILLTLVKNKTGHVVNIKWGSVAHSEEFVEDFLAHYGVKGMKWGVRKPRSAVTTSQGSTLTGKAKVKTTGGEGHNASPDAVKVAAKKAKLKKSGVAALSNKDLQDVIERARLETQARDAVSSTGKKFVKKKLNTQFDQQSQQFVREQIQKKRASRAS